MPTYRDLPVKVTGVTFKNANGSSRQEILKRVYDDWWLEGLEGRVLLTLRADDDNEYDEHAVKILVNIGEGWEQIGYVPARLALNIRKLLGARRIAGVLIRGMTPNREGTKVAMEVGIRIRVDK